MDPEKVDFDALLDPEHPEHAAGCDLTRSLGLVWDGWRAFFEDVVVVVGDDGPPRTLAWADMTHEEQHQVATSMIPVAPRNVASLIAVSQVILAERVSPT